MCVAVQVYSGSGLLWLNGDKQRCSSLSPSLSVPSIWLQGYRQIIGFTQQHLTYTLLTLGLAWPHMDMLPIVTTFLKIGAFWNCAICDHGNYCDEVWYVSFSEYAVLAIVLYKVLLYTDFSVTLSAVYIITLATIDFFVLWVSDLFICSTDSFKNTSSMIHEFGETTTIL